MLQISLEALDALQSLRRLRAQPIKIIGVHHRGHGVFS